MTCFWDGIIAVLQEHQLISGFPPTPHQLATFLKQNNRLTTNVTWQGSTLTNKQMNENYEHVRNYDISQIRNGYLCSTCDPFLLLIAQLFRINIKHEYVNSFINYKYKCSCGKTPVLRFRSDMGHFSPA